MENKLEKRRIVNIVELMDDSQYVIPSYQRGYEWGKEDVYLLLEDLKKYCEKKKEKECDYKFYCLQHITLYKRDGSAYYNVADGQQRLTTLAIILSYYGKGEDLFKGKLTYDVRKQTGEFLENQIYKRGYWNGEAKEDAKHKDEFYIRKVADAVKEWDAVVSSEGFDLVNFKQVLLNDVRFILNIVEGDEYRIFSDINGAKAELDGADLMRAVMITRSSKEKYGGTNSNDNDKIINEFRVKMGMELDAVNAWCGREEIKKYLELLLPNDAFKKTIFNPREYPANYIYRMMYEVRREKEEKEEFGFRYFEYGIDLNNDHADDNWEMYEQFKRVYNVVRDWYSDKEIFYYTSYLFSNYKAKVAFRNIYGEYTQGRTKSEFRKYLHGLVKNVVLEEFKDEAVKNEIDALKEHIESVQISWYENQQQLVKILILLDVIISLNSKSMGRMQLEDFSRRTDEDVEHIACQTPSEEDRKDENKWKMYVDELKANLEDEEVKSIISKEQLNKFEMSLSDKESADIVDFLNSIGLNSIGNLVLLNKSVNRGYKNAQFKDKKAEIFRNYFANQDQKEKKKINQIRHYTMSVFSMEKDGYWTFDDIKNNCKRISELIDNFFKQ